MMIETSKAFNLAMQQAYTLLAYLLPFARTASTLSRRASLRLTVIRWCSRWAS